MDVVFLIDTTGSMGDAINNVKMEAASLFADIDTAASGDSQLGLVTFKDQVVVHHDLAAGNAAAVEAGLLALFASGGGNLPEASDEALHTVINGLDEADRLPGQQIGDFDGLWRPDALKIAILITDDLPGGFDDRFTPDVDDLSAHSRALEAAAAHILISAIYVPRFAPNPTVETIMQDYATTSGGVFVETAADGIGTAAAIAGIIAACGIANNPPILAPIDDQVMDEGAILNIAVSATDPEADPITLVAADLPPFVSFTDHGDGTGTLILAPGFEDEGVYSDVKITVSDGHLTDSKTFTLTVNDVDPVGQWRDICVPQRMEITGVGMGDRYHTINPQTLTLADPANVNRLLVQVAGRLYKPGNVTLTTPAPQSMTLNKPHIDAFGTYRFEANLQSAGQITASVSNPGDDSYKTPRGLILYARRAATGQWTSAGRTTSGFVWAGGGYYTHTEVLTFPPLTETTDLDITTVVIDNDDDERLLVLESTAGGVTESITAAGPTDGPGLNILNLTLSAVPAGTGQANVTLHSPADNGDSLALVGLNVSYPCPASVVTTSDLIARSTDWPDPVIVGNDLTYTITIINSGPSTATGAIMTDLLPSSVTFGSAISSQGSCTGLNPLTCSLDALISNATAAITIVVTPTTVGTITNSVSLVGHEFDPDLTNNSLTEVTTVKSSSPLSLTRQIFLPLILK
jgi:uncharacterized repeat protein (TIGR01451 family)